MNLTKIYRAGGLGGIIAGVCWLLQPVLVFLVTGDVDESLAGTHEYLLATSWFGLYELVTFGGIGVGALAIVVAMNRLVRARTPERSVLFDVGQIFGVVAGVAWLIAGATAVAPYTSVGFFISEFVPGADEHRAVLEAGSLAITSALLLYAIGVFGWLLSIAIGARRAGIIGTPLSIFAYVCAAIVAASFVMPFAPPIGAIGGLLYMIVLGIALLVKSRRLPVA